MRAIHSLNPISISLVVLLSASNAGAQWQQDGVGAAVALGAQTYPVAVSDDAGGAIIVFLDDRSGLNDVYAQRVNEAGIVQWAEGGVPVCTAAHIQSGIRVLADGVGGAFVVWSDLRNGGQSDVYAQRINAAGVVQWATDGVPVTTATANQSSPALASDGSGGVIIAFDGGGPSADDICAQRVDGAGVVQWAVNGIPLCTATFLQQLPAIVSDGAGGAIVAWRDVRNLGNYYDVYAQRVNGSGVTQWTADGVALCTAANAQWGVAICSDGTGGAIVCWEDARNGVDYDVYAQRVNASGVVQWAPDGHTISAATSDQSNVSVVSDAAGGAIVTWWDARSADGLDVYAQRVNTSGVVLWQQNGVGVSTAANTQGGQTIIPDGQGGAILSWHDFRSLVAHDIYAQRLNNAGLAMWTSQGVPVCTATGEQGWTTTVPDGKGGAIVAWHDSRSGAIEMYAQRVEADFGAWGHPEPIVVSAGDVPGDQGGKVALNWQASGRDVLPFFEISHYSMWRAVDPVTMTSSGEAPQAAFTDPSAVGIDFSGHAVFHERIGATDYYWEWVANQNATHDPGYSYAVATREDSVAGNTATHYFRVLAHTGAAHILYKSNVMSGHSIDNLAPAAPLMLTAQRVGRDVQLRWNRSIAPDLGDYAVYRASASGVTPVPVNFLAASEDTVLVDQNTPVSTLYYIVTATDVHENQSAPSNEANVGALTGIGDAPSIPTLTVLQNYPNPFAGSADLEIGLPRESDVSIQIYDVAGRVVRNERVPRLGAGWQRVPLSDRGDNGKPLASGVYFYRVTAGGSTVTKKMVIAR